MIKRIGVFDSGLGGLTVLRELRDYLPNCDFVYLGDTARTPYGSKSRSTIVRYSLECTQFLLTHELDLLVVACNTASSWALDVIKEEASCPVIGTIEPAIRLVTGHSAPGDTIGVIGTAATVSSSVYETQLKNQLPNAKVISKACPLFVPLVEEGIFEGEIVDSIVAHYLSSYKEAQIKALILACTHYPLLTNAISNFLGKDVRIIECSKAMAEEAKLLIEGDVNAAPSTSTRGRVEHYFVTDEVSKFNGLARLLLNGHLVEAVKIENLTSGRV